MTARLALTRHEAAAVLDILHRHLPADTLIHVFGSRATGRCKPWSDLDLVIEAADVVPLSVLARIAEAFEESDLAWKVDVVDRRTVGEEFGRVIDRSKVPLR